MRFSAELQRRKVFRVAGAYLVGAWIVLQVADTLLPALEFPPWTVKLVAILAIVGFPVALIIGWLFDLTPGGIERTDDAVDFRFPLRSLVAGTIVVLIGVTAFMVIRNRVYAAGIDQDSVVVLPFRVSSSAEMQVMREGMVDLIVPKLTGIGGPRAVDSRTTLSAWRRAVHSEDAELAPIKAIRLARRLGAGQVMLGEVVNASGQIALNARLYSTIDGSSSARAHATAPQDSVLVAVDRLLAELLSRQAGQGENLSALQTSSLDAVQAYLAGSRLYRLGQYQQASKRFAEAVDADSTFALAAFGEMRTREWAGYGPRYNRARDLAFAHRNRLPPRERQLLVADLGEEFPKVSSYAQAVRRWEDAVSSFPDSPEAWYELGDSYFHNGQPLGIEDYVDRALDAWDRSIALDSSFAPPWGHQMQIHATRRDTAEMNRVSRHISSLAADRKGYLDWLYAAASGNDTMRSRLLREAPGWMSSDIYEAIVTTMMSGASDAGLDQLADIYIEALAPAQRANSWWDRSVYELNRGRIAQAQRALAEGVAADATRRRAQYVTVAHSIAYPTLDQELADRVANDLRTETEPFTICLVGFWDMLRERPAPVEQALLAMADTIARRADSADDVRHCRQMLVAGQAVIFRRPDARTQLLRMDSSIMNGPIMGGGVANFSAVLMARLYARLGDHERARQASLRGGFAGYHMSAQVLEHARAAAAAGRPREATESYRIYLAMQDTGQAESRPHIDQVRAELAKVIAR